ncbi:MAG: hypothetical protein LBE25_13655 [Arthrobacter sp.]|jgi:hypothetical protein|nr:hypothetical protein [Arthrobacter sp.]
MRKTLVFETAVSAHDATVVVLDGDGDGDGVTVEMTGPCVSLNLAQARKLCNALTEHLGQPTPAPAPFLENVRFEDVQVGDTVRVTEIDGGVSVVTEGKVETLSSTWARAKSGRGLVHYTHDADPDVTITILVRPTAQLPTEPGAVILVDTVDRQVPMTLDSDGGWVGFDINGRRVYWEASLLVNEPWKLAKVVEA